jgi:hypothetical protein
MAVCPRRLDGVGIARMTIRRVTIYGLTRGLLVHRVENNTWERGFSENESKTR